MNRSEIGRRNFLRKAVVMIQQGYSRFLSEHGDTGLFPGWRGSHADGIESHRKPGTAYPVLPL